MNARHREIAVALRAEWDEYHDNLSICHQAGIEKAAKIIANKLSDSDKSFKKIDFLKLAINY
mgnify:CR=1 FL=1